MDLQPQLEAFTKAYSELESSVSGLDVLIETYFSDIPAEAFKTITALRCISGFGLDLVCGTERSQARTVSFTKSSALDWHQKVPSTNTGLGERCIPGWQVSFCWGC